MLADRFGSYWMLSTRAGIPSFVRFQSIIRYLRLWPLPRWRTVIRPWLFRPAFRLSATVSDFSGLLFVISSNAFDVIPRRPGDVGLYTLIAIAIPPTRLHA